MNGHAAEMEHHDLTCKVQDGIAVVAIERPRKKNALTYAMWVRMAQIFRDLATHQDLRVIVLTGRGQDFCAGADITEFDTSRAGDGAARYEAANSAAFAAIREAPCSTIAAIGGICFGGGFGLAAACDLRVATADALFSVPAAQLGLAYPVDAMSDIVEALGPQAARYLTYSGGRIDATTAMALGFLLEVVEAGEAIDRAVEIGRTIAANAPLSVRASKVAVRASLSGAEADYRHATVLAEATFESDDYAEGRKAFAERRKPNFKGR